VPHPAEVTGGGAALYHLDWDLPDDGMEKVGSMLERESFALMKALAV
jgi:hypothetical protein